MENWNKVMTSTHTHTHNACNKLEQKRNQIEIRVSSEEKIETKCEQVSEQERKEIKQGNTDKKKQKEEELNWPEKKSEN